MTTPAEYSTINNGVIIGVFIQVMGFPTAPTLSAMIAPYQHLIAFTQVVMRCYPTLTFTLSHSPCYFNMSVSKGHIAPPCILVMRIIPPQKGVSMAMNGGRMGAWGVSC